MLLCMRTTIDIDDELFREVKRYALETDRTMRAVVEEALRADLARKKQRRKAHRIEEVITFRGRGTKPGVDLDSTADLLDLMESGR